MTKREYSRHTIIPEDIFIKGYCKSLMLDDQKRICIRSLQPLSNSEDLLITPAGSCFAPDNTLWYVNRLSAEIMIFNTDNNNLKKLSYIGGFGKNVCEFTLGSHARISPYERDELRSEFNKKGIPGELAGIAVSNKFITVSDTGNNRIQCFFRSTLQLSSVLDTNYLLKIYPDINWSGFMPWDCVVDYLGNFYVIDLSNKIILQISQRCHHVRIIGQDFLVDPVSLFTDLTGTVYVLDRGLNEIRSIKNDNDIICSTILSLGKVTSEGKQCTGIGIDEFKNFHVGECGTTDDLLFHVWNSKGNYCGNYENRFGSCRRIVSDKKGKLYAECKEGGIINLQGKSCKPSKGVYYTDYFNSGDRYTFWHRIDAVAEIEAGSHCLIDYQISNSKSDQKYNDLDDWKPAVNVTGQKGALVDSLLNGIQGQYLCFRITLGSDGTGYPALGKIRITFPHKSYLRYLPSVFMEDLIGRDLLDRFLSIFESFNIGIEEEIVNTVRYLDPKCTPSEYLEWLASWLSIIKDENIPDEKLRIIISQAYNLYKKRGTIEGLKRVLEIIVGDKIRIVEHYRIFRPMVIGNNVKVAETTVIGQKFLQPLVLECSSKIGTFNLIESPDQRDKPFTADAYDFTVLIPAHAIANEKTISLIRRLIEQEKPAHTRAALKIETQEQLCIEYSSRVEISTKIGHGYSAKPLGINKYLGIKSVVGTRYPLKGIYELRSRTGINTVLQ